MEDEEKEDIFFVLGAEVNSIGADGGPNSFLYSLVKVPEDDIEHAIWMQDGIDKVNEEIEELRGQKDEFGGAVRNDISKLETKVSSMVKNRDDYIGKNAISSLQVIEKGQQTFFAGDAIPSAALDNMIKEKVLAVAKDDLRVKIF